MGEARAQNIPFFIFPALITAGFGLILLYFFFPIFWEAVIASLFNPLYDRPAQSCNTGLAAGILIVIITLIVFLPLTFLGGLLVRFLSD